MGEQTSGVEASHRSKFVIGIFALILEVHASAYGRDYYV